MEASIENVSVRSLESYRSDEDDELVSDCESNVSNGDYDDGLSSDGELVRLHKDNLVYNVIHNKFMACLGDTRKKTTTVMAIHKKIWSDFDGGDSKLRCFEIYRQHLKNKYGDDKIMKYAWYATTKEDMTRIMSRGFGGKDLPLFGDGIDLCPINLLNQSVDSCVVDEDGLMHIMLCRVLVDRQEIIDSTNNSIESQSKDSDNFNSEVEDQVDDISSTKYYVRSTAINTHILPEYVISFKTPLAMMSYNARRLLKRPSSKWLTFSKLFSVLVKILPQKNLELIKKKYRDFKEKKISRLGFIQRLKHIVGVDILAALVKLCGARKVFDANATRNICLYEARI